MKENKYKIIEQLKPYKEELTLGLIFLVAFLVRIFISGSVLGHTTDMGCFSHWSEQIFTQGLSGFYSGNIICDYPPLYIYFLWIVEFFRSMLNLMFVSPEHLILLKLPSVIFDLLTAALVYKIAKKRLSYRGAILSLMLIAFSPVFIFNSSAWGQVDSIFTFFIALTAYYIIEDKLHFATLSYVLAVLLKPQAFIFAPILIYGYIRSKDWKKVLLSLTYGLMLFVGAVLPFAIYEGPLWIFDLYFGTMGQYAFSTFNAYNIYALLGQNIASHSDTLFLMPYKYYGYLSIVITCIITSLAYFKKGKKDGFYFATASFLMTMVFTFATMMHERYLFPSVLFVLLAYIYSLDKRFLYIHILQTITFLANNIYILSLDKVAGYDFFSPYIAIVSALTVFTSLWYIKVYVQQYITDKEELVNLF